MAFFRAAMLSEMTNIPAFYYANDCVFLSQKTFIFFFLAAIITQLRGKGLKII